MARLPADNLDDAFDVCEPTVPLDATDPRYMDLAAGRGDEGVAFAQCRKRILRSKSSYPVQLLAGYQNRDRWCDVQPAILELPRFKEAWQELTEVEAAEVDDGN